jgi:hypothetical protein
MITNYHCEALKRIGVIIVSHGKEKQTEIKQYLKMVRQDNIQRMKMRMESFAYLRCLMDTGF